MLKFSSVFQVDPKLQQNLWSYMTQILQLLQILKQQKLQKYSKYTSDILHTFISDVWQQAHQI